MTQRKAIVTVGLQFGDEGKGATVDYLCRKYEVDWVIRYCGGSQCGHNVVLPDGIHHTFAQWGSGTLANVPTYLDQNVIIDPAAMDREADHLRSLGVERPYSLLHLHPDCLVATDYHIKLNRMQARISGHGSCGMGVGEVRRYWLQYGSDAITVSDLRDHRILSRKMELLRQRSLIRAEELVRPSPYRDRLQSDWIRECGPELGDEFHSSFIDSLCIGVNGRYGPFIHEMPNYRTAIFEGAQGVLLDEWYGFHPHTTWSTVTPRYALERCQGVEITLLGICRTTITRHGAGPHPTRNYDLTCRLPDKHNPVNDWQGDFHTGFLDMPLLRYAGAVIQASCGRPLDGIALNWLDAGNPITVATTYRGDHEYKVPKYPDLISRSGWGGEWMRWQDPIYEDFSPAGVTQLVGDIAPVVIQGRGPTHLDREGRVW